MNMRICASVAPTHPALLLVRSVIVVRTWEYAKYKSSSHEVDLYINGAHFYNYWTSEEFAFTIPRYVEAWIEGDFATMWKIEKLYNSRYPHGHSWSLADLKDKEVEEELWGA